MAARVVNLGQMDISQLHGNLRLTVAAMGAFTVPLPYSDLDDGELIAALASGDVWVTRGAACQVKIRISLNGDPINKNSHLEVLEAIGIHFRDAHVSLSCLLPHNMC